MKIEKDNLWDSINRIYELNQCQSCGRNKSNHAVACAFCGTVDPGAAALATLDALHNIQELKAASNRQAEDTANISNQLQELVAQVENNSTSCETASIALTNRLTRAYDPVIDALRENVRQLQAEANELRDRIITLEYTARHS